MFVYAHTIRHKRITPNEFLRPETAACHKSRWRKRFPLLCFPCYLDKCAVCFSSLRLSFRIVQKIKTNLLLYFQHIINYCHSMSRVWKNKLSLKHNWMWTSRISPSLPGCVYTEYLKNYSSYVLFQIRSKTKIWNVRSEDT